MIEFLDATGVPGSGHDQVRVVGSVMLGGCLQVDYIGSGSFNPAPGQVFTIIDNDGTDPVVGTFAGLPEGVAVTIGGTSLTISYTGGTGNDVVLVSPLLDVNDPPVIGIAPDAVETDEDTPVVLPAGKITITDPDAGNGLLLTTVRVTSGTLTLGSTTGLTFITGDGADDALMVFTATLADLNPAAAGSIFKPTPDFFGAATIAITVDDQGNTGTGGAKTDSETLTISVTAMSQVAFANTGARVQLDLSAYGYAIQDVFLTGPTVIKLTDVPDDGDGNGREELRTEIVSMELTGGTALGPVVLRQSPQQRSLGLVEEQANLHPGQIDFPAESFFDVFFEIELPDETVLHNEDPVRVQTTLSDGLPVWGLTEGHTWKFTGIVPLRFENGVLANVAVQQVSHTVDPEIDVFPRTWAQMELAVQGMPTPVPVLLSGPTTVHVFLEGVNGGAIDDDGDGLDEVSTEIVAMTLSGPNLMNPAETITVQLDSRRVANPARKTFGQMEDKVNLAPGTLDVPPFASGTVDSFFDVYFEVSGNFGAGPTTLYGRTAKHLLAELRTMPPTDELHNSPDDVELVTAPGQPTGRTVTNTVHVVQPGIDFGDAPDPLVTTPGQYPTLAANNGAAHMIPSSIPVNGVVFPGPRLGQLVDPDPDGQPTPGADGDDLLDGVDDEDGVTFPSAFNISVDVQNAPGRLDAWIDFNRNGQFEAGEKIANGLMLPPTVRNLTYANTTDAVAGPSFARFRISTYGTPLPTGVALDGEVEDYPIQIVAAPERPRGSIHGFKYEDVDANSLYDPAIERRLGGVTITLTGDKDGNGTSDTVTVTTDANGEYAFVGLCPGPYTVTETVPPGWTASTPTSYTVQVGSREELVAEAGQAHLPPGDPRHEVVVGPQLAFGNYFTSLCIDLNTTTSATAAGYVGLGAANTFNAGAGFGWASTAPTFDRAVPNALLRDGHYGQSANKFQVNLPQGNYLVRVVMGDAWFPRNKMQVAVSGSGTASPASAVVSTAAGQFQAAFFQVTVTAPGLLNLDFSDLGGDPYWVVNALCIRAGGTPLAVAVPSTPLTADGVTVDNFPGTGATPNSLVTVATTLGTVASADADPNYAGIQVLADGSGSFGILIRRPGGGGGAQVTAERVTGPPSAGSATVQYALPTSRRFDFNDSGSPTQTPTGGAGGYVGVLPTDVYSAALGYGWDTALTSSGPSYQGAVDRGDLPGATPQEELRRDGHWSQLAHTFRVDLAPSATYVVNVTVGDAMFPRDRIRITNAATGAVLADGLSTAAGQWRHVRFPVAVGASGQLQLTFSDEGGDPYWMVNGLEIWPAPVPALTFTPPGGTWAADGVSVDAFTVSGGTAGALYTVATTLGTVVSADAAPSYAGIQVQATAGGSFGILIRRPRGGGGASVTAVELTGAAAGSAPVTYVLPDTARFDFNSDLSPTQTPTGVPGGYFGVRPTDVYSAASGYGWDTALTSAGASYQGAVDRGDLPGVTPQEELRRDGHWSQLAHTFRVDLAAGATYAVNVTVGDAMFPRDRMRITNAATGAVLADGLSTAAGQWRHVRFPVAVGASGQLQLTFSDEGGDPYWVVNGLEIWPAPVGGVTFTGGPGPVPGDGATVDTITGTGPANTLLTVTSSLGTILTDDSSQYAGTQVLTGTGGAFNILIRRPTGGGGWATVSASAVDGSAAGTSSTTVGYTFAGMLFDFNYGSSPTAAGYTGVAAGLAYTAARGYGWMTAASGFDRGAIGTPPVAESDLLRDGAYAGVSHGSRTFRADVAAGNYQVTVTLGDAWFPRDKMQVKANGALLTPTGGLSTVAGQFAVVSLAVSAGAGAVQVEFSDLGGDPYWVANAVTIRPVVTPGTLSGPANVPADGVTVDTFSQTGLTTGDLYTVATTLGTVATADANPRYAGTQVAVAGGTLSFQVRRPLAQGAATVTAQEVTGKGWSTGTTTYTVAPVRRFDFNGPSNDTAPSFVGVRGATTYGAGGGYGWNAAVPEFERTGPSSLRRDGHYGAGSGGATFTMQVTPGQTYNVRVYVGDASYPRDQIQVTVEGAGAYTIAALAAGSFDTRTTAAGATAASDGLLTVTIKDLGGDPYWVINGIDVWETGATPPGVQTLRAGLVGQAFQPDTVSLERLTYEKLTYPALAAVVEQAMGIWAGTGLTASQVALLRSTPVAIANLDAQGYLGLTTPERILIDDDGVGLGWDTKSGSGLSTLDSRPSYDLLTTVLHEMGHVLGKVDDEDAGDLMFAVLQPGERHLADLDAMFARW